MTAQAAMAALAVASATCGARPDFLPTDLPRLDGGFDEDGGFGDGGFAVDCRPCDSWGPVELMGPLPGQLEELSGLAASTAFPGVLYAHNDSGDTARFFAMTETGLLLAEIRLPGAGAVDWEDMAVGPCDKGSCIYLGDIGDNLKRRGDYTVYRVREPDLNEVGLNRSSANLEFDVQWDALPFEYPNSRPHNAETLLAHPVTGDLYVITKELAAQPSRVYKFPRPFRPSERVTLIDLGNASVPEPSDILATGGAISPCGNSVLVRLYNRNVELRAAPDAGIETAFQGRAIDVPTAIDEPQGEAITWGPDGQTYFTASEKTGQFLHRVRCQRAE